MYGFPWGVWTLMAIPIFAASRYLGSRHPAIHYHGAMALLLSLPVGFILMPLSGSLNLISVPEIAAFQSPAPVELSPMLYETAGETGAVSASETPPEEASSLPFLASYPATNNGITRSTVAGIIALIAGCISFLSLLLLAWKTYNLRLLRRSLTPVNNSEVLNVVKQLESRFKIRRPVRLFLVPAHLGPMTFGGLRPVIGIPQHLLDEPAVLKSVLYHEFIHVQRFDYVTGWLTQCIRAVFVFHPGVVLLARQIDTFRELSCDSAFLERATLSPADYARLLFRFSDRAHAQCSVPMVQKTSILKKRIKNMSTHFPANPFNNKVIIAAVSLFLFIPALLVACSSGSSTTNEDGILRLEAQVAYLQTELISVQEIQQELRTQGGDLNPGDAGWVRYNNQFQMLNQRVGLLNGMLMERMKDLELARLEAATSEWMQKVSS